MYINSEIIGNNVHIWERRGKERIEVVEPCEWSCYVEDPNGEFTTLDGRRATYFEFSTRYELAAAVKQVVASGKRVYESDVPPDLKALAKLYPYVEGKIAELNVTYLDIEVDYRTVSYADDYTVKIRKLGGTDSVELPIGDVRYCDNLEAFEAYDDRSKEWIPLPESDYMYGGPTGFSQAHDPYAPINAVALSNDWTDETYVIAVPPAGWGRDPDHWEELLSPEFRNQDLGEIILVKDERELLKLFLHFIKDSDALIGWNSLFFDFPYIAKRVEYVLGTRGLRQLSFPGAPLPNIKPVEIMGKVNYKAEYGGRILMDYMELFKKFEMSMRPSYKLEAITEEILPHLKKLTYDGTLEQLYRRDFNHFLRYNLRDTECLRGFEVIKGYVGIANLLYHMSCGRFKDVAGTLRLADCAILNYSHDTLNAVAPTSKMSLGEMNEDDETQEKAQGAFVLDPKSGLSDWGAAIDIASLYPSCLISLNGSPEMIRGQFVETIQAFEHIMNETDVNLTFQHEATGEYETRCAVEWKEWLLSKKYAISGYGTVFDQSGELGVIPSILLDWFKQRKQYKKKAYVAGQEIDRLIEKYKDVA